MKKIMKKMAKKVLKKIATKYDNEKITDILMKRIDRHTCQFFLLKIYILIWKESLRFGGVAQGVKGVSRGVKGVGGGVENCRMG